MAEVLANAEKKIDTAFLDQPLVEAGVRHAISVAFSSLGQFEVALRHAPQLTTCAGLLGPEHPDTLTSMHNLAVVLQMGSTDDKETQKKTRPAN